MKLLVLFLILFLVKSSVSKSNLDDYSINSFIDYMKNNGIFDILQLIKKFYGDDVAIISCSELEEKYCGNCQKLVLEYMPIPYGARSRTPRNKKPSIQDILKEKYSSNTAEYIYNKIILRAKQLNIKLD